MNASSEHLPTFILFIYIFGDYVKEAGYSALEESAYVEAVLGVKLERFSCCSRLRRRFIRINLVILLKLIHHYYYLLTLDHIVGLLVV